jgi:hypothetical protein
VERVGGTKGAVTVKYTMSGGTAIADTNYTRTNGTLSFADGETSKSIPIKLIHNKAAEGTKTFLITLSDVTGGATLGAPNQLTLSVLDAEGGTSNGSSSSAASTAAASTGFEFSAKEFTALESAGSATITVLRTGSTSSAGSVKYAATADYASTNDFTPTNGTLTFNAGETSKTFTVTVIDNSNIGGSHSVKLTLSEPTGSSLSSPNVATLMISDDELEASTASGTVQFLRSSMNVLESDGVAELVVVRSGRPTYQVSVNYQTVSGTATSGGDFTPTSGTLTFAPGETMKLIKVPLVKDDTSEDEEAFYVDLSNISSLATFGSNTRETVKIQ